MAHFAKNIFNPLLIFWFRLYRDEFCTVHHRMLQTECAFFRTYHHAGSTVITFSRKHHDRRFPFFRIWQNNIALADFCTGVAADTNTARISVIGVDDQPGTAFRIFNTLAKHNINVDIILQSVGRDGTKDITFTVSQDDLKEAMEVLEARKEALTIKEMNYNEKVAKVSIVGAGMLSNPGVAATMFESLSNSNININMISTSEIRITVLIDEKDADRALVAIHDGFGLED